MFIVADLVSLSKVNHNYMDSIDGLYIVSSFFYKNQNKREYLPMFVFSVTMPLSRKVLDVTKEQIYVNVISR